MFGGLFQADQKDPMKRFSEVLRYRLAVRKWEVMEPLPEAVRKATLLSPLLVKDRLLLISGDRKVWQFDLSTLQYSELSPMPEAASVDKFVWTGSRIIGGGGENSGQGPRRRSEWTFIGRFVK